MVASGAVHMLSYYRAKLQDVLTESLEDGKIMSKTILQAATARSISTEIPETSADMRQEIAEGNYFKRLWEERMYQTVIILVSPTLGFFA